MVDLRLVGPLRLAAPANGREHVVAASGLVCRGRRAYVVSDEHPAVGVFDAGRSDGGRLAPLDEEQLPSDAARRKEQKPDLEALAELPYGCGALLALGSGATERRERAWLWPFDGDELFGAPLELSLSELYARLRGELDDLNVEGAAVTGESLWLAQRGNGADGANALVELSLPDVLAGIAHERVLPASALLALHPHELGDAHGVPLTFSGLAPLPDGRLLFCAVAEDVGSTYHDGPCVGAAVGVLDPGGGPAVLDPLPEPHKIEGVAPVGPAGDGLEVLLVADPDDPALPSPLFAARAF